MNNPTTRQDKTRAIVDLIQKFGECVKQDHGTQERVFDLQGAARVEIEQQGLRRSFKILARGAEIHADSWRGQMGATQFVKGGEDEFNRILNNATRISGKIQADIDAQEAERMRNLGATHHRFSGRAL